MFSNDCKGISQFSQEIKPGKTSKIFLRLTCDCKNVEGGKIFIELRKIFLHLQGLSLSKYGNPSQKICLINICPLIYLNSNSTNARLIRYSEFPSALIECKKSYECRIRQTCLLSLSVTKFQNSQYPFLHSKYTNQLC